MKVQRVSARAEEIFQADFRALASRTDRMFLWLLIGQWLFAIGVALFWSPRTWIAEYWSIHQHVIAAGVLGALCAAYPVYCILRYPTTAWTRHAIAVGQMLQSALLVHVMGGRIETHFHVFGSLALLAFYRDWRVLITASGVVYLDHVALGLWFPLSAYGVEAASFWRSAEHAGWVVFEVVFLSMACHQGLEELSAIADRQAEIEAVAADLRKYNAEIETMSAELQQTNEVLETRVQERTQTLTREIAERRQTEEALFRQTRVLQSILTNMGEAVIVADAQGKFVLVNPAAERLIGVPLVDAPWTEWPAKFGVFLPDRVTRYSAEQLPLVQALRGEQCDQVEMFLRNAAHPDGAFMCCNARPIRNEDGTPQGGVVVFHDVTERKHYEEALAERARISALTADMAIGLSCDAAPNEILQRCAEAVTTHLDAVLARIWLVDAATSVLKLHASSGKSVDCDALLGRLAMDSEVTAQMTRDRTPYVLTQGRTRSADDHEWLEQHDIASFNIYPLLAGERLIGALALAAKRSLTPATSAALTVVADSIAIGIERLQAKEGLVQAHEAKVMAEAANRAKNEFLSRMSHELRTPLNAILGFGQLLGMDEVTEQQRECIEQITRGGNHLLALINEVLDITRIEAGRVDLSPEPVRVADAFQEALDLVQPLAARRGVQLHANLGSADGFHVLADNQKLKQVLLNLLSNAVKYNRDRGEVRLSCEQADADRVRLVVEDTGPGIAADKLKRLFIPFERLGAEQTGVEGSGLGLALSKSLVELMNGAITVGSTVGVGTRFCVELARVDDPQDRFARLPAETATVAITPSAGRTVLYVEDNLDNLRLVQRILVHRPGIQLLTAMQGSLGVELARQHRPDLMLLDVHLPDFDGEEVLHRLQAAPETRSLPVVVISADATARQIDRLLSAGATEYLTKPIDVPRLLRVLDDILQRGTPV